ncbi:hypothetical protein EB796_022650 [Bugula neritina]|uniref:Uncharacterized protein n=1 Tax=Bugula neritina TaxID=10212 RepID=A0A7J7IYR6_BUGNE|nr:hypothetical protein EB796_022650 [Bugula neritina]
MQASVFSLVLVFFLLLEVSSVPFGSQVRAKLGNKIIHLELPYQNNVFKIQKDLASATGGFLYSDGFAIYSIDANFSSASNTKLLGRNNGPRSGYAPVGQPVSDDVPPVNDLYALAGFVQLDTDTIVIVSIYQHCILGLIALPVSIT